MYICRVSSGGWGYLGRAQCWADMKMRVLLTIVGCVCYSNENLFKVLLQLRILSPRRFQRFFFGNFKDFPKNFKVPLLTWNILKLTTASNYYRYDLGGRLENIFHLKNRPLQLEAGSRTKATIKFCYISKIIICLILESESYFHWRDSISSDASRGAMPRTEVLSACTTLGENNKDCWRSKGVLELRFLAPSEADFFAEDLGFLESLIGLNLVGAKSVSGVFWRCADQGV